MIDSQQIYEDHVRLTISGSDLRKALFHNLLSSKIFEEVTLGIEEICVKFDPDKVTEGEVLAHIKSLQTPLGLSLIHI